MLTLPEFAENMEERCPCVLVLDTSASMSNGPIAELNQGVRQFREEILADPIAALRIELAVVTFGGVAKIEHDFSTVDVFTPRDLDASGGTPMGEAVRQALEMIENRKRVYRDNGVQYYRPWLWLMSDGAPTDDWQSAAVSAASAEDGRQVMIFAVGIGSDASMGTLAKFATKRAPLELQPGCFVEMFKWLSASLKRVSTEPTSAQPEPGQTTFDDDDDEPQVTLPSVDTWAKVPT